ncbi:Glycosyl transferase ALG6/ALG8, partial [Trinorchestia longiramus]
MSTKVIESLSIATLVGIVLRWAVSFHPYSGANKPPMFGDYEAQRHWQEITLNLPVHAWYTNSSDNDLLYWGLDYPPLTAYHSYLNGLLASYLNPDFVALFTSRGYEGYDHKLFMRYTVLFVDLLVFIPAAFFYARTSKTVYRHRVASKIDFLALMTYPGLILIDHGHFQYNNASLGFFVTAVGALATKRDCMGAIFFSCALNYKQMELYHALPFFFYLLGRCTKENSFAEAVVKLCSIGGSVVLVFLVVWSPYLRTLESLTQVVKRVFPVGRGLFEDKVASVWCSLSVVVKLREILDNSQMALLCLVTTAILCLPSCINLFRHVTFTHFKYSLVNVSLIFFLFSFHVHEKSILLVAVPACMLFSSEPFMVCWFLSVTVFSMVPLLDKDGLFLPSLSLCVLWVLVYEVAASHCKSLNLKSVIADGRTGVDAALRRWGTALVCVSALCCAVLVLAFKCIHPPSRYPDLFAVLIALASCAHFCFFAVYFHFRQFSLQTNKKHAEKKR